MRKTFCLATELKELPLKRCTLASAHTQQKTAVSLGYVETTLSAMGISL